MKHSMKGGFSRDWRRKRGFARGTRADTAQGGARFWRVWRKTVGGRRREGMK